MIARIARADTVCEMDNEKMDENMARKWEKMGTLLIRSCVAGVWG